MQQQLGGGQQPSPLAQRGQVQQDQTHVFAPVVTGALMKKPKYPVSGGSIGVCVLCLGVPEAQDQEVSTPAGGAGEAPLS